MKKKQEIVIKMNDNEQFSKYLVPDYSKIVCVNVYDKFWGSCEVMDPMVKKFLDYKNNATKVDFICVEKELTNDFFSKHCNSFTSKPKFFIIHKGTVISYIDGLDFPKLQDEVERGFILLEGE